MAKTKYKSSSLERSITLYAKPRIYMMFAAEMNMKMRGKSEHAYRILEAYYAAMPESQQNKLIEHYEKNIKK